MVTRTRSRVSELGFGYRSDGQCETVVSYKHWKHGKASPFCPERKMHIFLVHASAFLPRLHVPCVIAYEYSPCSGHRPASLQSTLDANIPLTPESGPVGIHRSIRLDLCIQEAVVTRSLASTCRSAFLSEAPSLGCIRDPKANISHRIGRISVFATAEAVNASHVHVSYHYVSTIPHSQGVGSSDCASGDRPFPPRPKATADLPLRDCEQDLLTKY